MRHVLLMACGMAMALAADSDPARVLQRVGIKVRVRSESLPNYTCVETVTRDYYRMKESRVSKSCAAVLAERQSSAEKLRLVATDRLRLDVTLTDHGEIYSWAGASKFEDGGVDQVVHQGPIATGAFGAMLAVVFGQDPRTFHFEKNVVVGGRNLLEYSFQVAKENSRYKVRTPDSWVYTAYSGRFQADPETEEVVRLTLETAELPPSTGSCQTVSTMDFSRVKIGEREFLLPVKGLQRFVDPEGFEVENSTTFAACREYKGESTVTFLPEPEAAENKDAKTTDDQKRSSVPLPEGLPFTFELTSPIAVDTAAGGDAVAGRLVSALRDAHGKVLAPAHARVEGRLLRVEVHHTGVTGAIVVMTLRRVEIGGVMKPLTADRDWPRGRTVKNKFAIQLPQPWEKNASVFVFPGEHETVKPGFRSEWLTAKMPDGR